MTNLIELKDLSKKYDDTIALNKVNLSFEKGKVYGLIGRNGAGKTTMLKLISNMLNITSGEIIYNTDFIKEVSDITFARDNNWYFSNYKIKRLIQLASAVYPRWNQERCDELIELFELDIKKKYIKASKGMQTMFSIIVALSSGCEVILLDEPYAGLDPINREHFYDYLRNHYFNEDITVIISSHLIKEIEGYFERAIIIDNGEILVDKDMTDIYNMSYEITCNETVYNQLRATKNIIKHSQLAGHYTVQIYDYLNDTEQKELRNLKADIKGMDLQSLFIGLCMKGGK